MNRALIGLFLILASPLGVQPAFASVVPGKWEKVELLPEGTQIIITLQSGAKMRAALEAVGPHALKLREEGRNVSIQLPKDEVAKIVEQSRRADSVVDGTWKGALGGAIVGSPWLIWGLNSKSDDATSVGAGIFLLHLLVGTGVGAGVDAAHLSRRVLYRAPKN